MDTDTGRQNPSITEIGDWLEELGFGRFRALFAEQEIDPEMLAEITEDDLDRWGVPFGSRKRLMRAIHSRIGLPAAERRQVTAVFCDMVGSTALAARLDPEDMRAVIAAYHETCRSTVTELGGNVVRYFGDGVFGCFGWPEAHEDDAERAVHAALAILRATRTLEPRPGITIQVRIGIATGLVVMGEPIGAGISREASMVGETPNLAARLQQVAAPDTIVISVGTRRLLGQFFELRAGEPLELKGIAGPVDWWEVVGEAVVESRFAAAHGHRLGEPLGRESELALLLQRWRLARRGEGQIVLLSGEPGIGKSRLAETVCERISDEPHMRFRYQCSPFHVNTPLYPVISQLERAVEIAPRDDTATRLTKLGTLATSGWAAPDMLPLLAELVSASTDAPSLAGQDSLIRKQRTLARLTEFLVDVSRKNPVLILIEDAHWIDPTTRELLDRLASATRNDAMFVLATLRSGTEAAWSSYADATRLQLNRLDRYSSARIMDSVAGGAQLPDTVRERILEKTDGVPLFIEELTKAALDAGLTTAEPAVGRSNPPRTIDIPSTLHDSLMARLDRLPEAKSVAQTSAVIGREFAYPLLRAVVPNEEPILARALRLLVKAEILFQNGTGPEAVYIFKHALLQDAAYASLLRGRRQELHGRIAEALRTRFPETGTLNPEVLAYHFTEAGQTEAAIRWWQRAGQLGIRRSADAEATVHLRKAIELLAVLPEGPDRDLLEIDLRSDLAGPLFAVQGFTAEETEANGERAWQLCERAGGGEKAFLVLWGRSQSALTRGDMARGLIYAEQLEQMAASRGGDRTMALARRNVGIARHVSGDLRGALSRLEAAIELIAASPDETVAFAFGLDPLCTTRTACALTLQQLGELERASEAMSVALREARQTHHVQTLAYVLMRAGLFQIFSRRIEDVGRTATELRALGRTHQYASWTRLGEMLFGWYLVHIDRTDQGLGLLHEAIEGQKNRGAYLLMPCMMVHESELMVQLNRPLAALERLAEAEEAATRLRQGFALAELHRVRAVALAKAGSDAAMVDGSLAAAHGVATEQGALFSRLRTALEAARIEAARGAHAFARQGLAAALAAFPRSALEADLLAARTLLATP